MQPGEISRGPGAGALLRTWRCSRCSTAWRRRSSTRRPGALKAPEKIAKARGRRLGGKPRIEPANP